MKTFIKKLFLLFLLTPIVSIANEDSFLLNLEATSCSPIEGHFSKQDARLNAYDKATLLAVKNSQYLKEKNLNLNDYDYNLLSYKIADRALNNVVILTTLDTKEKICLELKAILDKQKTDDILKEYGYKDFDDNKIKEITEDVNSTLPKSIYEAEDSLPLFYVNDLEFYTSQTSKDYKTTILEELSFVPRVLVTDTKELADYIIAPKLTKSSIDVIDEKNSRYSMSVKIEIKNKENKIILEDTKNRYLIIDNNDDKQALAKKMLTRLLKENIKSLSNKLSVLFIEKTK